MAIILVVGIYIINNNTKILAFTTDKVAMIQIVDENNWEKIKVDNKEDINKVIDNLQSI